MFEELFDVLAHLAVVITYVSGLPVRELRKQVGCDRWRADGVLVMVHSGLAFPDADGFLLSHFIQLGSWIDLCVVFGKMRSWFHRCRECWSRDREIGVSCRVSVRARSWCLSRCCGPTMHRYHIMRVYFSLLPELTWQTKLLRGQYYYMSSQTAQRFSNIFVHK